MNNTMDYSIIRTLLTFSEYRPEMYVALPNYEPRYIEFEDDDVPDYSPTVIAVYRFDHQWGEDKYMYRFMGVKVK